MLQQLKIQQGKRCEAQSCAWNKLFAVITPSTPAVTTARLWHVSTADVAQGSGQSILQHLNHMSTAHIDTHLVLLFGVATNLKVLAPLQTTQILVKGQHS